MVLMASLFIVAGWGVWQGVEKGLLKNSEFQISKIELNPNLAMDEIRLLEVAEIDLSGSLFQCSPGKIEKRLERLPELAAAKVTRKFPGTLQVKVLPRKPYLWVASGSQGILPRDRERGLLVDVFGVAFRCRPGLYEQARLLPVIELGEGGEPLRAGSVVEHPDYLRGVRLFSMAQDATEDASRWIDTIGQHKAWASFLTTRDGMTANFGHADLERQMSDLLAAVEHAREKGDRIATIQLIGKRNLPVTFHEVAPPRAIPVDELPESQRPPGNSDLRNLLER